MQEKYYLPKIETVLRHNILEIPEKTYAASGILIYGRRHNKGLAHRQSGQGCGKSGGYLNSLEWDGQKRIRFCLRHFLGAEADEYTF